MSDTPEPVAPEDHPSDGAAVIAGVEPPSYEERAEAHEALVIEGEQ